MEFGFSSTTPRSTSLSWDQREMQPMVKTLQGMVLCLATIKSPSSHFKFQEEFKAWQSEQATPLTNGN